MAVDATVLVGGGWTSVGVSEKRVIIDVNENENKMGTVLVDDCFLSRNDMMSYVQDNDDTLVIRCRIHVFDNNQLAVVRPQPLRCFPPHVRVRSPPNRPKTKRDNSTGNLFPAKRPRFN